MKKALLGLGAIGAGIILYKKLKKNNEKVLEEPKLITKDEDIDFLQAELDELDEKIGNSIKQNEESLKSLDELRKGFDSIFDRYEELSNEILNDKDLMYTICKDRPELIDELVNVLH